MALSVVIPTLGSEPHLPACLAALSETSNRIVVLQSSHGFALPHEQLVRLAQPVGFAAAVNAGLRAADSAYVGVVNDDCVVDAGWATPLLAALAANPKLAAVQGVVRRVDGRVDTAGISWNRWYEPVQRGWGLAPAAVATGEAIFGASATAVIYRRAALTAVGGGFDEVLGTWYEDVELAARLRIGGWEAARIQAAGAVHQGGSTTTALALSASRRVANRWLVLARILGRQLPRAIPRALVADLRQARGAPITVLRGWLRALRLARQFAHFGAAGIAPDALRRYPA